MEAQVNLVFLAHPVHLVNPALLFLLEVPQDLEVLVGLELDYLEHLQDLETLEVP
jgi:hypothetical protein